MTNQSELTIDCSQGGKMVVESIFDSAGELEFYVEHGWTSHIYCYLTRETATELRDHLTMVLNDND